MRRVNFLARLQLDIADGENVFRALVQQLDDLRVQLIDRLPMFGNVHSEGRMQKEAGRIKYDSLGNSQELNRLTMQYRQLIQASQDVTQKPIARAVAEPADRLPSQS